MRGLFIGGAIAGLLLGLFVGLVIAWVIWPVTYTDADPADLSLEIKDDYLRMIAHGYNLDGDMARALAQINALRLSQPIASLANLARRETKPLTQQALVQLALDLRQPAVALARPTFTPRPTRGRGSDRRTPTATLRSMPSVAPTQTALTGFSATPLPRLDPTLEPTATVPPTSIHDPNAPRFELEAQTALTCAETGGRALIQVNVQDTNSRPLPGIGVEVNWNAGDEVFYTGLKPERGLGYADFAASAGTYSVRLTENAQSPVVANLTIEPEPAECAEQLRGWSLLFRQTGK